MTAIICPALQHAGYESAIRLFENPECRSALELSGFRYEAKRSADKWGQEIRGQGLESRLPRGNLACSEEFVIPFPGVSLDIALAQSVFTHLPINHLRLCLHRLRPRMAPGGRFFCTFFVAPSDLPRDGSMRHKPHGEVESFGWKDPFHVWREDIEFAVDGMDWRFEGLFDWNHPRGQIMAHFHAV